MDKPTLLKAFNNHFMEFIEDILRVFPDDTDIIAAKNGLISIKKANPKLVPMIWSQHIGGPYGEHIAQGDIGFFIDKDYTADIDSLSYSQSIISKIDVLREPVRSMGEENQQKVMRYIQNLTKLADMYVGMGVGMGAGTNESHVDAVR
jgi:hypothetical protein